eukprot:GHVO01032108.1.p1 GENE.GHVO01032108.1~~GHVO01032108.1.p1  ORF type:complete len:618 (-),score=131.17 GHVO01032108.1:259-2112(-)
MLGSGPYEGPPPANAKAPVPISRVLKLLKPDAWKMPFAFLGAALQGATWPCFSIVFGEFIQTFMGLDGDVIRKETREYALWFLLLAATSAGGALLQTSFFEWAGQRIIKELRDLGFHKLLYQDMEFFDDPANSTGHLCSVLSKDVQMVKGWCSDNTGVIVGNLCSAITGLIIAFHASPKLAAVTFAAFILVVPASMLEMQALKGSTEDISDSLASPGYVMHESIRNISVVNTFNLHEEMESQYATKVEEEYIKGKKKAFTFGLFFGLSQFIQYGAQALTFYYGGKLIEETDLELSLMLRAIFALMMAAMGIGQSAVFMTDTSKAKEAAANVYDIIDRTPGINCHDDEGIKPDVVRGDIQFKQVNFRYNQRKDVPIYKDMTFNISEGETVALVGESGCGKSTVVQLLERLYDASSGSVTLDGSDVRTFNVRHLRRLFGLVSQEPVLFEASIAENIRLGNPDTSMEEVIAASKSANAHSFIMDFPDGYDTDVGKSGSQLSGGQKQRIAIARAMVRNPRVLLLDEATSALDAESEKIVQTALDDLLQSSKRTTVVIAHRLSTVRNADKIIVMTNPDKSGSYVAEMGSHDELLAMPEGLYRKLLMVSAAAASGTPKTGTPQ